MPTSFTVTGSHGAHIVAKAGHVDGGVVELCDLVACDVNVLDWAGAVIVDGAVDCRIQIGRQFRCRDLVNCKVSLYSQTDAVIESSHHLVFAPYLVAYPGQDQHFQAAQLNPADNHWHQVLDFSEADKSVPVPHVQFHGTPSAGHATPTQSIDVSAEPDADLEWFDADGSLTFAGAVTCATLFDGVATEGSVWSFAEFNRYAEQVTRPDLKVRSSADFVALPGVNSTTGKMHCMGFLEWVQHWAPSRWVAPVVLNRLAWTFPQVLSRLFESGAVNPVPWFATATSVSSRGLAHGSSADQLHEDSVPEAVSIVAAKACVWNAMKEADQDGDNSFNVSEFNAFQQLIGAVDEQLESQDQLQQVFGEFDGAVDAGGNVRISVLLDLTCEHAEELLKLGQVLGFGPLSFAAVCRLVQVFLRFDEDQDQAFSLQEFNAFQRAIGSGDETLESEDQMQDAFGDQLDDHGHLPLQNWLGLYSAAEPSDLQAVLAVLTPLRQAHSPTLADKGKQLRDMLGIGRHGNDDDDDDDDLSGDDDHVSTDNDDQFDDDEDHRTTVPEAIRTLLAYANDNGIDTLKWFQAYDRTSVGSLDVPVFLRALHRLGQAITEDAPLQTRMVTAALQPASLGALCAAVCTDGEHAFYALLPHPSNTATLSAVPPKAASPPRPPAPTRMPAATTGAASKPTAARKRSPARPINVPPPVPPMAPEEAERLHAEVQQVKEFLRQPGKLALMRTKLRLADIAVEYVSAEDLTRALNGAGQQTSYNGALAILRRAARLGSGPTHDAEARVMMRHAAPRQALVAWLEREGRHAKRAMMDHQAWSAVKARDAAAAEEQRLLVFRRVLAGNADPAFNVGDIQRLIRAYDIVPPAAVHQEAAAKARAWLESGNGKAYLRRKLSAGLSREAVLKERVAHELNEFAKSTEPAEALFREYHAYVFNKDDTGQRQDFVRWLQERETARQSAAVALQEWLRQKAQMDDMKGRADKKEEKEAEDPETVEESVRRWASQKRREQRQKAREQHEEARIKEKEAAAKARKAAAAYRKWLRLRRKGKYLSCKAHQVMPCPQLAPVQQRHPWVDVVPQQDDLF